MNNFAKIIGYIALLAATITLNGFAVSVLWGWFIVTTFGLVALTIPQTIGMGLVVSYMTVRTPKKGETDGRNFGETVAVALAKPAIFLLIGWIVTKFL